jgi:hypothetical protein
LHKNKIGRPILFLCKKRLFNTYTVLANPTRIRASLQMVARRIAPSSNMWRAQNLVNMNMVAGINCEFHHM